MAARLYAKLLRSLKVVEGISIREMSAMQVVYVHDIKGFSNIMTYMGDRDGGVRSFKSNTSVL